VFQIACFAGIFFLLDRFSKIIALDILPNAGEIPVIKNIFTLCLVKNRGIAFGMLNSIPPQFLTGLILVAVLLFTIWTISTRKDSLLFMLSISLIIGGSLGNLLDRLVYSHIIDFIQILNFPVFNIADMCITSGFVLLLVCFFLNNKKYVSNIN